MKIIRVALQNFRLHANSEIRFAPSGTTGLVGQNEGGKSTVLEAIAFSLFGSAAIRGKKSSLRWSRAPARKPAAVVLEFEIGGTRYRIERSESDARLFEAGQDSPIAAGTSAVDDYVPRLLGMSLDEFRVSYMCEQHQLAALAAMGPTQRKQFFLRVLGVGQIDEALKACRARKNELAHEFAGMELGMGDGDALAAELSTATAAVTAAEREESAADAALRTARCASEAAAGALSELESDRIENGALEGVIRTARAELETATQEVRRAEAALVDVPEAVSDGAMEALKARQQDLVERKESARHALSKYSQARASVRAEHEANRKAAEREAQAASERGAQIRSLGAEAPCPTCTVPLQDRYAKVLAEATECRESALTLAEGHRMAAAAVERKSDAELAIEAEMAALDVEIASVSPEIAALQKRVHAAEVAEISRTDLQRWREKASRALASTEATSLAILELAFDPERYAALSTAAQAKLAELIAAEAACASKKSTLLAKRERLVRAGEQLAAFEKRAEALAKLRSDLSTHEQAADGLQEFRTLTAGGIRPDLEALASGFIQILTDGRHEGLLIGDDFDARLLEDGVETEVISGGTQDLAAIAMRLAVSQMIAERAGMPLSLLFLDEPFGSLDAVRRSNVLALLDRLRGVFEQIILISHVEETRDAVDHVVQVSFDEAAGHSVVQQVAVAGEIAA